MHARLGTDAPTAHPVWGGCGGGTDAPTTDPVFGGRHVYFVGVGGSGMSGLAQMLHARGAECAGTDAEESALLDALRTGGIPVTCPESGELPDGTDLMIRSAAVRPDHPAVVAAGRLGIQTIAYAEALGLSMSGRTGISVAGTHGKSTTTSLLAHCLVESGLDPSVIVGATCGQIGGGSRTGAARIPSGPLAGRPGLMVAEACEFNRSFLQHRPTMALINNVEEDHLDCYGSLDEIVQAFRSFALLLPAADEGGRLLIAEQGAHRRAVAADLPCAVSTFGWAPSADYQVVYEPATRALRVMETGVEFLSAQLLLAGEHNALNAAAAGILARWSGASRAAVERALATFRGVDRRMQFLGERTLPTGGAVRVFDDYGHHPTEIERTLKALRQAESPRRIVCVFQPHQHSRTRFLMAQFAQSFSEADLVIVPHIYFVRDSEEERTKVSAADLVERLKQRGVEAIHIDSFEAIVARLDSLCRDGDLLVVMGAGPVWKVAHGFLAQRAEACPCPSR